MRKTALLAMMGEIGGFWALANELMDDIPTRVGKTTLKCLHISR
jgi:hypothetical protein